MSRMPSAADVEAQFGRMITQDFGGGRPYVAFVIIIRAQCARVRWFRVPVQ
jgi:hypothetical protein